MFLIRGNPTMLETLQPPAVKQVCCPAGLFVTLRVTWCKFRTRAKAKLSAGPVAATFRAIACGVSGAALQCVPVTAGNAIVLLSLGW